MPVPACSLRPMRWKAVTILESRTSFSPGSNRSSADAKASPGFQSSVRLSKILDQLREDSTAESFCRVLTTLLDRLSGEPWGRMPAMKERFGISW